MTDHDTDILRRAMLEGGHVMDRSTTVALYRKACAALDGEKE